MIKASYIRLATFISIDEAIKVSRYSSFIANEGKIHEEDQALKKDWQNFMNKSNQKMEEMLNDFLILE